jgi:hypothetical protein
MLNMNRTPILILLSLLAGSVFGQEQIPPESAPNDGVTTTAIIPIFSQRIGFELPSNWHAVFEDGNAASYMIEFTPRDQSIKNWREMITVQGLKGFASQATALQVLDMLANQIQPACPESFIYEQLGESDIDGHEAQVALIGCGNMPTDMPTGLTAGQSEIAYYLSISGNQDHYVFQKATRGSALAVSDLPSSLDEADRLISLFSPIQICRNEGHPADCEK